MIVTLWPYHVRFPIGSSVHTYKIHSLDDIARTCEGMEMISVAWDRDVPGLDPQPLLVGPGGEPANLFLMSGPRPTHPPRMFANPYDPCPWSSYGAGLMFLHGKWSWRENAPGFRPVLPLRDGTVKLLRQDPLERFVVAEVDA